MMSVRKSSADFTPNPKVCRYSLGKSLRLFVTMILAFALMAAANTWQFLGSGKARLRMVPSLGSSECFVFGHTLSNHDLPPLIKNMCTPLGRVQIVVGKPQQ